MFYLTMTFTRSVEDAVDAADGWHIFGTECHNRVLLSCHYLVHGYFGQHVEHGDSTLWTALMSSSLGYMLPNPSLKREDGV